MRRGASRAAAITFAAGMGGAARVTIVWRRPLVRNARRDRSSGRPLPGAQTTGEHEHNATGGRPLPKGAGIRVELRYGRIVHDGDRTEAGRWPHLRQARRACGVLAVGQAER